MKGITKKYCVIGLIVILTLSMMAGCSGKDNNPEPATSAPALGGNNASGQGDEGNSAVRPKISWAGMTDNYPLEDESYAASYLEENFNVDIEIVRVDDPQQLNLLLSTNDVPDIFASSGTDIRKYAENGIISEIPMELIKTHMPNYYKLVMEFDDKVFSYASVDGKVFALPLLESTVSPVPVAIRGDWLKNVGADIPVTLQELEDVFVKFRNEDPDRNGKKDTYGLTMASDSVSYWFQTIFGAFGTHPFLWLKSGERELAYGFTLPETKDALKLLHKWYGMDLIDPEFVTDKRRTNGQDDVSYKFASGRVGYIDTLTYDDHQWDNDGQLNAKWVANAPEWQQFFNDADNTYVTTAFTEIPESGPQPVYVNIKPPVGPEGKSSSFSPSKLRGHYIMLGKGALESEEKLIRILQIFEADVSDEETYVNLEIGPEGVVWEWNDQNQRVYKKEWMDSDKYHPQGRILGTGIFFDLFFQMNPEFNTVFGGPRAEQRYKKTQELISTTLPGLSNQLLAPIESAAKYNAELQNMLMEYIIKAIMGEVDIDATYDATVQKWLDNGGREMTDEANAWYKTTQ
ncbi:hypothetical protein M6D81_29780 [Paenibacillus sp. J5C_2022]|uniref:hypothetical protein n=1 Tax=Paenibacillus sp. J5C2022 TaxID=2977129 RepID=UPI0021D13D10|nr:hypothetical protein [Paenibacillus sp. J5C2022]MCU6712900.1 hypothetical protein [Paenibacillus sp. J5C2022]